VAAENDTFTERIQMQIMRNLELHIKDLHIRYEDNYSKPEHPFSFGFTLDSIEIKTTDENWLPTYLKDNTTIINKLVSLNSLAIYCDSDDNLFFTTNKTNLSHQNLIDMIACQSKKHESTVKYILNPMSITSKMILNVKPKLDNYQKPMFDINILLESVLLDLNRLQVCLEPFNKRQTYCLLFYLF
jgi:vacuolar protein sorting-associated protein 13A/C